MLVMVYARIEARLARQQGEEAGRLRRLEEALMQGGLGDYPRRLAATFELPANGICLAAWPARRWAAVGLGDGRVQLLSYFTGRLLGSLAVARSGVLCAAVRPDPGGG